MLTDQRLARMSQLQPGWNGYDAPPPSPETIEAAARLLDMLRRENYEPDRVAPSVVGGVGITKRRGERKVYVEFYNDGHVMAMFSQAGYKLAVDYSGDDHGMAIVRVEPESGSFKELLAEMREYLEQADRGATPC